jgi:hypothetical protein
MAEPPKQDGSDTLGAPNFPLSLLDELVISDSRGYPSLRFGHYVDLAVEHGDTVSKRKDLAKVILDYLQVFRANITDYLPYDENQTKPIEDVNYQAYVDERAEAPDDPETHEGFSAAVYGFHGDEDNEGPTLYWASAYGNTPNRRFSSFEAYLPASWPETHGYPAYVEMIRRWCTILQPAYGTAGLSILFNEGRAGRHDQLLAFPLAKRFVGLDRPAGVRWYTLLGRIGVRAIRTVNWLSVIDDQFVSALGGLDKLKASLGPNCPVYVYPGGIIIQAGKKPEIGDVNQGKIPAAYRTVSHALAPIRFEQYPRPLFEVPEPLDALEETLKWVTRFD